MDAGAGARKERPEGAGGAGAAGEGSAEIGAAGAQTAPAGRDLRPEPRDDGAGAAAVRLVLPADAGRGAVTPGPVGPPGFIVSINCCSRGSAWERAGNGLGEAGAGPEPQPHPDIPAPIPCPGKGPGPTPSQHSSSNPCPGKGLAPAPSQHFLPRERSCPDAIPAFPAEGKDPALAPS